MGKKVLFTASTYSHINSFHVPYIKAFEDCGWTVYVACGGEMPLSCPKDRYFHLPFRKSVFSSTNFKAAFILRNIYKKQQIDLICCHTSLAAFFARLAALGIKKHPHICNVVHGYLFDDNTPYIKGMLLKNAELLTASVTDTLVVMNDYDYRYACEHHLGKIIKYTPGVGVDFTAFDMDRHAEAEAFRGRMGLTSENISLIFAAEFSVRKNQRILIDVLKKLPENVVLFLPGEGEQLKEVIEYARKSGLEARVFFPGRVSDMALWYAAADIAVSSSRSEGLPFNIMEAMYTGLPVVASNVKGHTDLITDGTTGFLCEYGVVQDYVDRLGLLVSSKELRSKIGKAAKEAVKKYSLNEVRPQLMKIYLSTQDIDR